MNALLLAILAVSTDPAPAAARAPAAVGSPVAHPEAGKLICEKTSVTGSRLAKRKTCLTKQQWKMLRDHQQGDAARLDRATRVNAGPN